jgi:hypothetical protein
LWTLRNIDSSSRLEAQTLKSRLIPATWADEDRLREQALVELGQAGAPPPDVRLADLVADHLPPTAKLSELSQVDGRFDPGLLEAVLRHLVDAWEEASTGSSEPLRGLCGEEAVRELCQPAPDQPRFKLLVTDATLDEWRTTAVEVDVEHPRVEARVSISAVRYLVDNSTGAWVAGNFELRHRLQLLWTLALVRTAHDPWRLIASTNPTVEIPGLPYELPQPDDAGPLSAEVMARRATKLAAQLETVETAPSAPGPTDSAPATGENLVRRLTKALTTIRARVKRDR